MKISKELLSEVLKLNITYTERCNNSIVYKISVYDREEEVNIYELAHKCKEWAFNKGYSISIHQSEISGYIAEIHCGWSVTDFHSRFEPEAIIKACEWVLKELNEK